MRTGRIKRIRCFLSLCLTLLLVSPAEQALAGASIYLNAGDGYLVGPLPDENIFSGLDRSMVSPEVQKENTI
ncbi:MAG: hypothetical protein IJW67_01125, partial [Blautia sp.]|nr:hypothetical protein [Blautia sp.]